MVINLPLTPDLEADLIARAAASGQDVGDFVLEVVRERLDPSESERQVDQDQWRQKLTEAIRLHPASQHFVDDSRESIY